MPERIEGTRLDEGFDNALIAHRGIDLRNEVLKVREPTDPTARCDDRVDNIRSDVADSG